MDRVNHVRPEVSAMYVALVKTIPRAKAEGVGVGATGKVVVRRRLQRSEIAAFIFRPAWWGSKHAQPRIIGRG
jgi:hypothetical protein